MSLHYSPPPIILDHSSHRHSSPRVILGTARMVPPSPRLASKTARKVAVAPPFVIIMTDTESISTRASQCHEHSQNTSFNRASQCHEHSKTPYVRGIAYGEADCDFGFDSHEWDCSNPSSASGFALIPRKDSRSPGSCPNYPPLIFFTIERVGFEGSEQTHTHTHARARPLTPSASWSSDPQSRGALTGRHCQVARWTQAWWRLF